ncbi:MAG: hypothetical protein C0467_23845 [Planctomycetaceae bacterium]|nr:hypothetical protein [Planctomycetaceae bacterium]
MGSRSPRFPLPTCYPDPQAFPKLGFRSQTLLDMSPNMGHTPRKKPTRYRRAIAGSVVVHLLLVSVGSVAFRAGSVANPGQANQPGIDTRADEPTLRLLPEELSVTMPAPPEPIKPPEEPPPTPEPPVAPVASQSPAEGTTGARPPVKNIVPNTLPTEVLAIMRRPKATPVRVTDPNVKPAGAVTSAPLSPAIHGAMKSGQTVLYVLDCSGSMGEFGKLTLARAALVSTLRRQPADVRFQVIAYNSTARSILPGLFVVATPANITTAETGLASLKATGRSNHIEAIRAAAALRPDVIVLLTDAEDLTLATFKAVLAGVGKSVPVCVARVTAEGVGSPRELK